VIDHRAMLRLVRALLICGVVVASTTALAVHTNPRGLGQVLLFPYYTVRSTDAGTAYNTLFLITNTASDTKIVRVRFRESANGREVAAINAFLTPFDTWAAAVVPANPGAGIVTFDKSCIDANPAIGPAGITLTNASYSGTNTDGGDPTLDRTMEGFFEAIEMGVVQDQTALAALHPDRANDFAVLPDCPAALAVQLDNITKVAPPTGGLMGSAFIINVLDGTLYPYEATALDDFSSVAMWAPLTVSGPTLQDVNPKASDVLNGSGTVHSIWDTGKGAHPADPVTAVLMQEQVLNYFILDKSTASETDWVVTMPTKPFYTDSALTGSANAIPPFETPFTAAGAPDYFGISPTTLIYPNQGDTELYDREGRYPIGSVDLGPNPLPPTVYLKWTANVLTFYPGDLLASPGRAFIFASLVGFENGWARLVPFRYPDSFVHQLVSTDVPPRTYFGLPMIGFMANSYVNGTLSGPTGPVLSNYGATSPHKGLLRIQ